MIYFWGYIYARKKNINSKDTFTPMFRAVLSTIAKTWKQSKCPLTDKWITCMYKMEYYVCKTWNIAQPEKKNERTPFTATQMQITMWSKLERERPMRCDIYV